MIIDRKRIEQLIAHFELALSSNDATMSAQGRRFYHRKIVALKKKLSEMASVTTTSHGGIQHIYVPLDDGRTVILFVNRDTNLVVVDVTDSDEKGGVEILRRHV